jgi:hypothetical protein
LFVDKTDVPKGWNQVTARIRDVVYLGALRKVVADLKDGGTFTVICQPDQSLPLVPDVLVAFPPEAARVVLASDSKNH